MTLPFTDKSQWRWRWMYDNSDEEDREGAMIYIHRIAECVSKIDPEAPYNIEAVTACNRKGVFSMPGLLSRMGAPRCPKCCAALGIPEGDGAPFNKGLEEKEPQ